MSYQPVLRSPVLCFAAIIQLFTVIGAAEDSGGKITSAAGYEAVWRNPEEGYSVTTLKKGAVLLSEIDGARPVSFSPDGNILLVREAQQDDDCRHYLLNLEAGEYRKTWVEGEEKRIGGRFVVNAVWSDDGKTITLKNADFIGGSETIKVSQYCRQIRSGVKVTPEDPARCEVVVSEAGDRVILDIKCKFGIGRASVEPADGEWPRTLTFRFHLRGLEGLKITRDGKLIADRRQATAYLKNGSVFPEKYLNGKQGYYQVDIPQSLLPGNSKTIEVHWVDFYR